MSRRVTALHKLGVFLAIFSIGSLLIVDGVLLPKLDAGGYASDLFEVYSYRDTCGAGAIESEEIFSAVEDRGITEEALLSNCPVISALSPFIFLRENIVSALLLAAVLYGLGSSMPERKDGRIEKLEEENAFLRERIRRMDMNRRMKGSSPKKKR